MLGVDDGMEQAVDSILSELSDCRFILRHNLENIPKLVATFRSPTVGLSAELNPER